MSEETVDPKVLHAAHVIVYVSYIINEYIDMGLVKGQKFITEQGIAKARELMDAGFSPSEEEIISATEALVAKYKLVRTI